VVSCRGGQEGSNEQSPDACEVAARELIVSHWPMVLMIAAALLEHEVLTYDEVCALLEP